MRRVPLLLTVTLLFIYYLVSAQEFNYSIEKYSYDFGLKDNYIVGIDVSKDNVLYVANRLQILKSDNGRFVEIVDLSQYPTILDFAVDDRNYVWLLLKHNGSESFDKKVVLLDPDNYQIVDTNFITEDGCSLYQTGWYNFFKDQNFNLYLNSAFHSEPNLKISSESNILKYAPSEIKLRDNLLYSKLSEEYFYGSGANRIVLTPKSRRYRAVRIDALNISGFLYNCQDSVATIPYLSDAKIDELSQAFTYRLFFSPYNDEALIYNQHKFCIVNSSDNSIIKIHELFQKEFENLEILNAIKVKNDIWISTSDGLIKVSRRVKIFQTYLSGNFTQTRNIVSVGQDSILVATEHGIQLLNLETKEVNKISRFYTTGLFLDGRGLFYGMGKPGVLEIYQQYPKYEAVEDIFFENPEDEAFNSGFFIEGCDPIFMSDHLLFSYDEKFKELKPFPNFPSIDRFSQIMTIDSTIFILEAKNIFELNPYSKEVTESELFKGLELHNVTYLHHDKVHNDYWICTNGYGLIEWNPTTKIKKTFGLNDGLNSLNIHSIYPDSKDRFWMSTDYGISIMDRKSENIVTLTHEDGLHQNEMNRHSSIQLADSSLVFGSIDGVIHFAPNELEIPFKEIDLESIHFEYSMRNDELHNIIISVIKDNELSISPNYDNPTLQLGLDKNTLYNNIRYKFKNDPSEKWLRSDAGRISLNTISKEDELLISNQVGLNKWSEPLRIKIFITKPIYKNLYFYLGLILISLVIISMWSSLRRYRAEERTKLIQQKVDVQTKELTVNNLKLKRANDLNENLFSIIGHDLKSPLLSFLNLNKNFKFLHDKGELENLGKLNKALERNSVQMLNVINRLLDWSVSLKSETISNTNVSIEDIFNIVIRDLQHIAIMKSITLMPAIDTNDNLYTEKESLIIIIRNITSNAIKFSNEDSYITLQYSSNVIKIIDNGVGMTNKQVVKILNNSNNDSKLGTTGEQGLGLGLKICHSLAQRIGIDIAIEKNKPNGTIFILTFAN